MSWRHTVGVTHGYLSQLLHFSIYSFDFPNSIPYSRHRQWLWRNTRVWSFWRGTVLNSLQCNTRNKTPHSGDVIAFDLLFMIYLMCRDRGTIICTAIFLLAVQSPLQSSMRHRSPILETRNEQHAVLSNYIALKKSSKTCTLNMPFSVSSQAGRWWKPIKGTN